MPRPRLVPSALLALTGALVVAAAAPPAGAADLPVSQSRGFFLAGSVGGTDLGTLAKLQDAAAVNTGGDSVTSTNPLGATVLNAITIPVPGGITIPLGVPVGAVNQYAQANPDGSAVGSSGAVADNGAIQTSANTGGPAANATLDLQALAASSGLPAGLAGLVQQLGDVSLSAGALAGQADRAAFDPAGTLGGTSGKYQIGSLGLTVKGPAALTGLFGTLTDSLTDVQTALDRALGTLSIPGVGAGQTLAFTVTLPDSALLLSKLTTISGPGFTADLSTGTLTLDVVALLQAGGVDINNLPPNTDLVPLLAAKLPGIVQTIVTALTTQLQAGAAAFTAALADAGVTATLLGQDFPLSFTTLGASGLLPADLTTATAPLTTALTSLTGGLSSTLGTGLGQLGSALSQLLQLIANGQSNGADGTFTETALSVRLLPGGGGALPTALQLDLGNASVGPGATLPAVTNTPPAPLSNVPTLANTGPFETLGSLALGTWAVVAGVAMLFAANAVRRSRLLHVGNHRG